MQFGEELLETARTEDLAKIVERVALIRWTRKELQFAELHLEEETEPTKIKDIKRRVLDELHSIPNLKDRWNGTKFCWTGSSSNVESWSATALVLGEKAAQSG